MRQLTILYLSFIAISFLCGITIYFQKKPSLYLRVFPVFLLTTLTVELYALYLNLHNKYNIGLYNVYNIIETTFYLYVLHEVIFGRTIKRIIVWEIVLYILFAIWNMVYGQGSDKFNNISAALSSLLIVSTSIVYFIQIFQMPKTINLLIEPSFWICCGLIFFNTCTLPYFGLVNFLANQPISLIKNIYIATNILNIFLYILFSISFLCRLQVRKYT